MIGERRTGKCAVSDSLAIRTCFVLEHVYESLTVGGGSDVMRLSAGSPVVGKALDAELALLVSLSEPN